MKVENGRLIVKGKKLPKGDIQILKILMKHGAMSVHEITLKKGSIYSQYTSSRLRFLKSSILDNIVVNHDGKYEINPVIKEELRELLYKL